MAPYEGIQLGHLWIVYGLGLAISLLVLLARGARRFSLGLRPSTDEALNDGVHEFGGDVTEGNRPLPVYFWLVLVGYVTWSIGYVIMYTPALGVSQ